MTKGARMLFAIAGFMCFVVTVVIWLKGEDSQTSKLNVSVEKQNELINGILHKYDKILESYVAQESANKVIHETQEQMKERIQLLELRVDAESKLKSQMPNKFTMKITQPLQLKMTEPMRIEQPIQVIYREAAKVGPKTKSFGKSAVTKQ